MSLDAMARVWKHSTEIQSNLVAVLHLADRADEHGVAWPGYDETADRVRCGRRRAIKIIQQLIDHGEVWMTHHDSKQGRQTSNRYLVLAGLSSGEIYELLSTHPQLQIAPQDADAIVVEIERRRQARADEMNEKRMKQAAHAAHMRGVVENTPENGRRGVAENTLGVLQRTPGGVAENTPGGVAENTRTQIRTHNEPKEESKEGDAQKIWQQALADLQLQIPKSTFDAWLLGTTVLDFDGETFRVEVRNALATEWLGKRLDGKIEQVVAGIAGHHVAVEFEAKGERP